MKGDHTKIVSVRFGCNWPCGVGEMMLFKQVSMDGHVVRRGTVTDHNSLLWYFVPGELKTGLLLQTKDN